MRGVSVEDSGGQELDLRKWYARHEMGIRGRRYFRESHRGGKTLGSMGTIAEAEERKKRVNKGATGRWVRGGWEIQFNCSKGEPWLREREGLVGGKGRGESRRLREEKKRKNVPPRREHGKNVVTGNERV